MLSVALSISAGIATLFLRYPQDILPFGVRTFLPHVKHAGDRSPPTTNIIIIEQRIAYYHKTTEYIKYGRTFDTLPDRCFVAADA